MQTAGFHDPNTDPAERLLEFQSTLWYHDHRVEHTAENVYKGLLGFELLFNAFDTGDENTGFRLPSFPQFDIPLALTDKLIDPGTGKICFDLGVKRLWLENRLEQVNGRAPTGKILPAGQRENVLVEFRLVGNAVRDNSVDPADPTVRFYALPPRPTPRITRRFRFERGNGQWQVNGRFMDCDEIRFTVNRNSAERWILENNSGGWQHPIHIHLEEFQIVRRNGQLIPRGDIEFSRKDVVRLQFNEKIELVMRFRDFRGDYPMHCHNTIHEDHAMMLLWAVQDDANDNNTRP